MGMCPRCGAYVDDAAKYCTSCGEKMTKEPEMPRDESAGVYSFGTENPTPRVYDLDRRTPATRVLSFVFGVLGALLFSLGGAVLYFVLYRMGVVAAASGIIMFYLAYFGFGLFSGRKGSVAAYIVAALVTVVMIYLSQYFCAAYSVWYYGTRELGMSFMETVRSMPTLLKDPDVKSAFRSELLYAYFFGLIGLVSAIYSQHRRKKTGR